jgi:hypothetical protein
VADTRTTPRTDRLSLLVGVVALIGAGLTLLDAAGAVQVDEVVTVTSLWIGLAVVGLVRSAVRLQQRLRS